MIEHRLIERMVGILEAELESIKKGEEPDIDLIMKGVDFFRTYADRTHHGKEEDILFRDLREKEMTPELKRVMDRLNEDHRIAREHVKALLGSANSYGSGKEGAEEEMVRHLSFLVEFYPVHIELEDKHFFYPCQDLFTKEESDAMLEEFWDFDRKMIHERYGKTVSDLENGNG